MDRRDRGDLTIRFSQSDGYYLGMIGFSCRGNPCGYPFGLLCHGDWRDQMLLLQASTGACPYDDRSCDNEHVGQVAFFNLTSQTYEFVFLIWFTPWSPPS